MGDDFVARRAKQLGQESAMILGDKLEKHLGTDFAFALIIVDVKKQGMSAFISNGSPEILDALEAAIARKRCGG